MVEVGQDYGIEEFQKRIFRGILKQTEGVERRRKDFVQVYRTPKLFKDEYYVLATIVKEFPALKISSLFVRTYMITNKVGVERSKNIDINRYALGGEDGFGEFLKSVEEVYAELQKGEVDDADYLEALEGFKMHYLNEESMKVLEEGAMILSEGISVRGKEYAGYDAMQTHVKTRLVELGDIATKSDRKGVVTYGEEVDDGLDTEETGVKLITPYGIPSIDEHTNGGIHEGDMISLLAPPKGGKSRFATYIMHTAAINGTNVLMWSIENGLQGFESLIRARQCEYFYNDMGGDMTQRVVITDDQIKKRKLTVEIAEKEKRSWMALRSNAKYGKISSIDADFDIDTFIEVIDSAIEETGAKLICVDYLQLVQGTGNASKHERVGEAYQKMLQYLKKKKVAGIFPGQLKQGAMGILNRAEEDELDTIELRDQAAESSEVVRTPDINFAIFATEAEKEQGIMKLLGMPSRTHARPKLVKMSVNLGTCSFYERH